ncbi:NUDIX hydrolase [Rhizobium laguerreae]|uniref:NUDIX domain-containing protein n=1 Tax=Rhizobium laguerreae TaxID=1076926 RepID=UPI001C8FA8C3|nr:NUDIX hydrolase [Rhizobium laguerreae]MBY3150886.1 NUDIX hydrolase [Rhizobium laguerreae]
MHTKFEEWQKQAEIEGIGLIVGALVLRDGCFFAHRRAYDRKLFPGCWDVAGGHVETGETLIGAVARELREETGWELDEVLGLATVFDWKIDGRVMREYEFVVTVKGSLEAVLEEGKAVEGKWVDRNDTASVAEHGNHKMKEIFDAGFAAVDGLDPR